MPPAVTCQIEGRKTVLPGVEGFLYLKPTGVETCAGKPEADLEFLADDFCAFGAYYFQFIDTSRCASFERNKVDDVAEVDAGLGANDIA